MHLVKIETNLENFKDHFDEILTGVQALKNLTQVNKDFNSFINSPEFIELIANLFYKKTNNILLSTLLANKIAGTKNNIAFNWLKNKLELNSDLVKNIQNHMVALFSINYLESFGPDISTDINESWIKHVPNQFKINEIWKLLKENVSIRDFLLKELIANIELLPDNCFTDDEIVFNNNSDDPLNFSEFLIIYTLSFENLKLTKALLKHYSKNDTIKFVTHFAFQENINNEFIDLFLPNPNENIDKSTKKTVHKTLLEISFIVGHMKGSINIVKILLPYVQDINYSLNVNRSFLRTATLNNHLPLAKLFLENNANANFKDETNESVLMAAVQNNNLEIVKLLLKHGADINAENNDGNTALSIAQENNFDDIVELLMSKKSEK